jgi:hypothetical protein
LACTSAASPWIIPSIISHTALASTPV